MPDAAREKIKVFVVDDHPLVREMMTDLVNQQPDMVMCGEADSAPEALRLIAAVDPAVAIVDLSLKDSSGLALVRDLVAAHPNVAILVLSMHDELLYAERVLRNGAKGYIMKQEATGKVIAGIHRILDGKIVISESLADAMALEFVQGTPSENQPPLAQFTDRELDIFDMLGQGHCSSQIATNLRVSVKTVHAYYGRMREKLALTSLRELRREALRWYESKH